MKRRSIALFTIALFVALAAAGTQPQAQTPAKKALTIDDYTRWRSISDQAISPDGAWVTYVLETTNVPRDEAKPVLHLLNLQTNADVAVPNARGGTFSSDSRWLAYHVDPAPERRGRGARATGAAARDAAPPPPRRVELRNIATGAVRSWEEIESFLFAPDASYLVLKRRRPESAGGGNGRGGAGGGTGGGGGAPDNASGAPRPEPKGPRGTDVVLLDLRTGRDQLLASVGDLAFTKSGELMAYTVDAAPADGNGLFVFDTRRGRVTPLDNDAKTYSRLAWSDDGKALAALKGVEVEKMRERDNVLLAFTDVPSAVADGAPKAAPVTFDPRKADGFPATWVVSDRSALTWSDDDQRVFFGMKPQMPAPAAHVSHDEAADVDVWNTSDERIQSVQMIQAERDRNFTYQQALVVSEDRWVKLADETMKDLEVAKDGRWAVGRDARAYVSDYKRPSADIYRVNTTTGERTLMLKAQIVNTSTGSHVFGISPDGRYFLYWKDLKFQAYDLDAGTSTTLAAASPVSFVDTEFDHPGPKPAFGVEGYTSDGKGVMVDAQYDLWLLPLNGSAPRDLTGGAGAKGEIRFRYVRTEPDDPPTTLTAPSSGPGFGGGAFRRRAAAREKPIDLSKPVTLSAFGQWTKKSGFYELANGALKTLVYEDALFSTPDKAAKADEFLFTRQTEVEFPDLRVSGPGFADSRKITDVNPQQAEYLWGHRVLFDFKDHDGHRLQGILTIPDDYKPGEKRPMLVTFYEKNSQNLHRYPAPAYLSSMGSIPEQAVSDGYITMVPDVYFHTGASHSDMLEAVETATKKVIAMGYVDPKHIGINGHSYGGEGAAFIGTRSRLFAAVGMGAGVVDLYYDFNQNWGWSYQVTGGSGANGSDYYLYSQGREGASPWDKPEMYMFESALTHVPEVTAPFLIMHGAADPTVAFTNGLAFYNALRFNGKKAVLLAYPGEGHHLDGMANRRDLTTRYFQFFDHFLKGAPAPEWWTKGVTFLEKEREHAASKR